MLISWLCLGPWPIGQSAPPWLLVPLATPETAVLLVLPGSLLLLHLCQASLYLCHGRPGLRLRLVPPSIRLHQAPPSFRLHLSSYSHWLHLSPRAPWLHLCCSSQWLCLGLLVLLVSISPGITSVGWAHGSTLASSPLVPPWVTILLGFWFPLGSRPLPAPLWSLLPIPPHPWSCVCIRSHLLQGGVMSCSV